MKPLKDMTGKIFGYWKVIHRGPNTKQGQAQWICVCSKCNCLKVVKGSHLREGRSTKCKNCHNKTFNRRHGQYNTATYAVWESMKQRCTNPSDDSFPNYGGRGISICERWKNDFINFWIDMGNKPETLSLERVDNEGNYCKENCRWATKSEQQQNTRRSHKAGNIYGDWRLIENIAYSKKSKFACIKCGKQRTDETFYVTSGKAASCKCL
jgi:hypothetical protein